VKTNGNLGDLTYGGRVLWALSPLTPDLSPLRGEGAALDARQNCATHRRVPRVSELFDLNDQDVASAAMLFALTKEADRAPSPLNGERAGVRGETVHIAFLLRGFSNTPLVVPDSQTRYSIL